MIQHIAHVALIVKDYDEAIDFYTRKLGFRLLEDTQLSASKRWVLVEPPGKGTSLLLAKATNEVQESRVGNQAGGRVFLFLYTDDFWTDHRRLKEEGVIFVREPSVEIYGTVAVFRDLYGNPWDLIQPAKPL
jgi:catechol 2,3-dioxygenase-like lactoylglutathione lyase family enzyme